MKNKRPKVSLTLNPVIKVLKKFITKKRVGLHEPYFIGNEKKYLNICIKNSEVASIGNFLEKFRKKIKKITKSKYVVLTSNGTSALHLALIGIGLKKNQEVLMPSLNYIASANAVLYCNARPHFVDVNEKTLGVDPEKLKKYLQKISIKKGKYLINKKTKRIIKGLICLHTFGYPAEIQEIKIICKNFNICLIEDAAEALGSYYKNKHVGTFGEIGTLSFNGNKIVTSGAGGAILTNSKVKFKLLNHLANTAKINHPFKFQYNELGFNYRMANVNAALGLAQIEKLNHFLKLKKKLYNRYKIAISKNKEFTLFNEPKNTKSNHWLCTIILNKNNINYRDKILKKLNKLGYLARPLWNPLHKIIYLKKFQHMNLEKTNYLNKKIINIPSSAFI
jgi:perosamine synthetase